LATGAGAHAGPVRSAVEGVMESRRAVRAVATRHTGRMRELPPDELRAFVERQIRRRGLIPGGGNVTCLVSGGADSTCLWHVLRELGYVVSAAHVNHKLRGEESGADARFCAETLGAEVVEADGAGLSEAELRAQRYQVTSCHKLRATGHTASDQV